jgi:hypothetical protein
MPKKPTDSEPERTPAEAMQMTRGVMKAMLEMAPEQHDAVQRRAKRARKKAPKQGAAKR